MESWNKYADILASSTQHNDSQVYPFCCMYQQFLFFYCWIALWTPVNRHLFPMNVSFYGHICFHFWENAEKWTNQIIRQIYASFLKNSQTCFQSALTILHSNQPRWLRILTNNGLFFWLLLFQWLYHDVSLCSYPAGS